MSNTQRRKGARIELELVHRHHDAALPCEKVSRTGYSTHDLLVADEFRAEVKARGSGKGFKQLEAWLGANQLLFLRRDRADPLVVMPWHIYVQLLRGYLASTPLEPQQGKEDTIEVPDESGSIPEEKRA